MEILIGIWLAAGGAIAALTGLSGMRHSRRLRRYGAPTWAMIVPRMRSARSAALSPGQSVLVWYDPEDPQDLLIGGRNTAVADIAFLLAGIAFVLLGTALAAFGR